MKPADSQRAGILAYLQAGNTLTPLQAQRLFQCLRLSGRILELRDAGHPIATDIVRIGRRKKVARYRYVPSAPVQPELPLPCPTPHPIPTPSRATPPASSDC